MQEQRHRDMFTDLYRLYEKYEVPPTSMTLLKTYFADLIADLEKYYIKYEHEPVAVRLSFGLLEGLVEVVDNTGDKSPYVQQVQMAL